MPDSALDVFHTAETQLTNGRYAEALLGYLRVVRGVPAFWRARFRVADTLLNLQARAEALEVYKALAWQAVKGGQPLQGLVAIKMAALLDPNQREAVEIIAQLYSHSHTSDRVQANLEALPRRVLQRGDRAADVPPMQGPQLVAAAGGEAADTGKMGAFPQALPPISLFSFLDESTFVAVLDSLQLRRFAKGNDVITEGAPGDSFFCRTPQPAPR